MQKRRRSQELERLLAPIDAEVPGHLAVHLVLDDVGPHRTPALLRQPLRRRRSHLQSTSTSAWWLDGGGVASGSLSGSARKSSR